MKWTHLSAIFCKLGGAVNPLIYGLMLPNFKKQFKRLMAKKFKRKSSNRISTTSSPSIRIGRTSTRKYNNRFVVSHGIRFPETSL